jgi:putative ABC transport system permease protein
VIRDIQFGFKMLWKDRAYAITAILTLALCIGANTAIFTIVHSVLLKPLPVPDSDRILQMSNQYPNMGSTIFTGSAVPDYYDRLQGMSVYEEQAMYDITSRVFNIDGSPEGIPGIEATPSLFRLLKVQPIYGRIFDESEGETGSDLKVILSYGLWQQLYGGDPGVIGKQVRMGGYFRTIVGVLPRSFQFVDPQTRFWVPLAFTDQQKSVDARHQNPFTSIGRLKSGATIQQAQQQVNAINAANLERFPQFKQLLINAGFYTRVDRLQDVVVQNVRGTLYLLWGGAALVLLIGAANLANLALARSNGRIREISTRLAIGASRAQVAAQLTTESVLLTLIGGLIGILTGLGMLRALMTIGLDGLPRASEIQMDFIVIGVALGLAILAGFLIGMVSVAHVFKANLNEALHEETRTGTQGQRARTVRRGLVVAQVAFAFMLLIDSGLLVVSFLNLLAMDPGFKSQNVLTASLWIPESRYPSDTSVLQLTNRLLSVVRTIPGVVSAGATTSLPLGGNRDDGVILAEGYQMKPGESVVNPRQIGVTPGYFEAIGTPLLRGRFFEDRDNETATPTIIVDERLARKFWPSDDPIGKRMYIPGTANDFGPNQNTKWLTIVGVVPEVRLEDLARTLTFGAVYLPAEQSHPRGLSFTLKTSGDPAALAKTFRSRLRELDPEMPPEVRVMSDYVALSLVQRRAVMLLATSFGIVSLFLSVVGIYGVLSFLVTQRYREIGIRIALGSTPLRTFALVLREGIVLIFSGLIIGLAGASALRQFLQGQVYGLAVMNPVVICAAAVTLSIIAIAASSIPARRATRVDPVTVLNQQ